MTIHAFGLAAMLAAAAAFVPAVAPDWVIEQVAGGARRSAPDGRDPRCDVADRTAVAHLQPLLERAATTDPYVVDRALHALDIARAHCSYGWVDTAIGNYAWLERWIDAND